MKANFVKVVKDYNKKKKEDKTNKNIFILKNKKTGIYYLSLYWSRPFIETLKAPENKKPYYEIYL